MGSARYALGRWDLSELCGPKGRHLESRIRDAQGRSKKFQAMRDQLAPDMPREVFSGMIKRLEEISGAMGKVGGYASLEYAADTQSDEAAARIARAGRIGAEVGNEMIYFDLWWKKLGESDAQRLMKNAGELSNYLVYKRKVARHSLAESEEKIINILDVTGASAMVKLYDRITGAFEYTVTAGGKKRTMGREELTSLVRSPRAAERKGAYCALFERFAASGGVLGDIYRSVAANWYDEGIRIRKYDSAISIRNTENDTDDKTVRTLLDVCKDNAHLFQGFFKAKARMRGMKRLARYDLYAPAAGAASEHIGYDEAVRTVLGALGDFSPKLGRYAKSVFDSGHVDSEIRPGKRDGAFCSTITPDILPYILVNYTGKTRDVFTLAHELGHAVHSVAASAKSILVQEAPLPLAETASTFSELLLYDAISNNMEHGQKRAMLAEKIDDFYATIMRQSYFTIFEIEAHKLISDAATAGQISAAYMANLKSQFGRSVDISEDFGGEWMCIPHFYHAPFYCYAYAFGNLLALSLFQRYKKEGPGFARTYEQILAGGGSVKPEDLLARYDMDITGARFWQDGFDFVASQIKELSKVA